LGALLSKGDKGTAMERVLASRLLSVRRKKSLKGGMTIPPERVKQSIFDITVLEEGKSYPTQRLSFPRWHGVARPVLGNIDIEHGTNHFSPGTMCSPYR
jgi:hypothetical protein